MLSDEQGKEKYSLKLLSQLKGNQPWIWSLFKSKVLMAYTMHSGKRIMYREKKLSTYYVYHYIYIGFIIM